MRSLRRPAALLLALVLVAACGGEGEEQAATTAATTGREAAQLEGGALVEALRGGGFVLYFRHAATDWSMEDTDTENLERCEAQRNLSEEGREQARRIGRAFRALELPVGRVLASRYCRTRETARLAFGRATPTTDLTSLPSAASEEERERRVEALRDLLSAEPAAGRSLVLVAHLFNIQAAADVSIAEGEAGVFEPRGDGFRLVATVTPEEWEALAGGDEEEVAVEEFEVPEGSHPHDVAPAQDGTVWYTAQFAGALGRLDPASGETEHVPLGDGSAPHGVIVGPDGAPWVTDGGLNAIVRVDPETREVETFRLPPDAADANLNTATFDGDGVLWFTRQNGVYGRLDPDEGRVEAFEAPRGPGPYGIATTPFGEVYYASLAGSHIARIDTETGRATVIEPPTSDQGARRIWSDSRGRLWVSEWNAGKLGMYDPRRDAWREWELPGESPQPYAVYVDEDDLVWLSDFGADALVTFDPGSETFETVDLPSEGASVRQLLGRPGEVWAPESGTDRIAVVRTP